MNLVVLSIILIIVMLLAVYAMTRQNAIESEIQTLVSRGNIEQLYDDYRANHRTLNLYVAGGILLTGAFALTFFGGGGIDPREWGFEQYVYALVGMVATVSITLGQKALYRSIKQNVAALLVTLLVLAFVIFSEVATTSEREASLVRDRSLDSPTLQAVLQNISTPDSDTIGSNRSAQYAGLVAHGQSKLRECRTKSCKEEAQRMIDTYTAAQAQAEIDYQSAVSARRADKLAFTEQATRLEYNEQNHSAVIKWIKEHFGVAFTAAMMFASLIFVVAFESGFHFTGTKEGIYLEAISRLGYTVKRKSKRPTRLQAENSVNRASSQDTRYSHMDNESHVQGQNELEDTRHIEDMKALKAAAEISSVGEMVTCPTCSIRFNKRIYNQSFCNSKCRDEYHNTIKPERKVRG